MVALQDPIVGSVPLQPDNPTKELIQTVQASYKLKNLRMNQKSRRLMKITCEENNKLLVNILPKYVN